MRQSAPPHEVVVALRSDDAASRTVAAERSDLLPLRVVTPDSPGFVPALRKALAAATGDAVACTDDDARPRPDWLQRIAEAFSADPRLVAIGGRDERPYSTVRYRTSAPPGSLSYWGRFTGRHEEPWPDARNVVHLRGVNMAFRAPWPLPHPLLRGDGTGNEADMCLSAARHGGLVRFDPALVVDHLVSPRAEDRGRSREEQIATLRATKGRAYNHAFVLARHTSDLLQRAARLSFVVLVGQATAPGLVRLLTKPSSGPSRRRLARQLTDAKLAGWRDGRRAARRDRMPLADRQQSEWRL